MSNAEVLRRLMAYVEFDATDAARLAAMQPTLAPHFERFADHFYERVLGDDEARGVFADVAQVHRLKHTLQDWMSSGLRGPHDEAYYERRSRIGQRHVQIGLRQHFMLTAMNVLRQDYAEVLTAATSDVAMLRDQLASVNRLFDIELAIMLRHYQANSERQLLEQERQRQGEKVAAMQALTAGLAHEVRNPLNSAKLQLSLLQRRLTKAGAEASLVEPAKLVHDEIDRLTNLLNDFLAFARPPRLDLAPTDLRELVRHVWELERPWANARNVALELRNDTGPVSAQVDAKKMHQVIFNLVRNALEATSMRRHAPSEARVGLGTSRRGSHAVIEVWDNGEGMPEDVLRRIYEPFFSTKPDGTGIGMAIVQNLVQLHGGTLEVETSPGGTRFTVVLVAG